MIPVLKLASGVLLHLVAGGWVASNPRTRDHVRLTAAAVEILSRHGTGADEDSWCQALASAHGWDSTGLNVEAGLWAEASALLPEATGQGKAGASLLALLRKRHILVADQADADAAIAPLLSILDRDRMGSFHQRVGQYLTLVKRQQEKWRWWQSQKFSADGLSVLPGPYRDIQEYYFDKRFAAEPLSGRTILDFGCGNGFFSRKFSSLGATVIGLDSSPELLQMAADNGLGQDRFLLCPSPTDTMDRLAGMPTASIDLIYLSDTFLLLSDAPGDLEALHPLLAEFRRLLTPGGKLHMFEPNPIFWLASYYGDADRPYAVISEYRHPVFNVAPTLDTVITAMATAGFGLIEYQHPDCRQDDDVDAALRHRANAFPMWDFFTFVPL